MCDSNSSQPDVREAAKLVPVINHDTTLLNYQIWRSLLRGCSTSESTPAPDNDGACRYRRPALPIGLVQKISRLSCLYSVYTITCEESVDVASDNLFASKMWFHTPPFVHNDDSDLFAHSSKNFRISPRDVAALQLLTNSNDQGWASEPHLGSWTWFEWGVFSSPKDATRRANASSGAEGWQISHHNKVAEGEPQDLKGPVVAVDGDNMSEGLEEGAVIAVRACAQFSGWHNFAYRGQIKVWVHFKPNCTYL